MGGLGMFSVSIVLWAMGLVMDMEASGSDVIIMASLPAILIVLFGARLLVEIKSAKSA